MDKYLIIGCAYFIQEAMNATDKELIKMWKNKENKYAEGEMKMRGLISVSKTK